MVVRETRQMADSLVRPDLRVTSPAAAVEPLTVDVLSHRDPDTTATLSADETGYEVKQGGTKLSSQNLAVLTSGLKIMTSLRGHFVTKVKSVDGLSSSSRRSEDDDGYCSRSSLDSPVQTIRPDGASPTTEDPLETFGEGANFGTTKNAARQALCVSPQECVGSCDGANDELKLDCNSSGQTVAAVASLDHCYLTSKDQDISPVDAPDAPSSQDCEASSSSPDDPEVPTGSAGRRNISIFVVPQPMPSTGLRWRARIIRAGSSADDESSHETVSGTTGSSEKPEPSHTAAQSASWLPLSAVAAPKSTVGTTTQVAAAASARRTTGYRQRLTVSSRLAALTATADSLSRQIARVAGATSARTGNAAGRAAASTWAGEAKSERRRSAGYRVPEMAVRLHPLVDHDYGAFATFNAEVQSSIISTTTDGVSQLDWRSIRRHRPVAGAAGAARGRAASSAVDDVPPASSTLQELRQKRKYCRRQNQPDGVYGLSASSYAPVPRVPGAKPGRKGRPPAVEGARRQPPVAARKRPLHRESSSSSLATACSEDDSRSYVKIPGHYQDDFVYYATKRARGRPRKNLVDPGTSTLVATSCGPSARSSTAAVGGINVFDWYREMAETDKSTRFGVTTATSTPDGAVPPAAGTVTSPTSWADTTPVDESAVADLVMDMLPSSTAAPTGTSGGEYISTSAGDRSELTVTEEDVCAMLRSLNEADLRILESHLGAAAAEHEETPKSAPSFEIVDKVEPADTSLSQYLNDCGRDSLGPSLSQTSASNGLLDVDEISDGDLLSADIGNMHVFLSDLRTPTRDIRTTNLPVTSKSNLSALFDSPEYSGGEPPVAEVQTSNSVPESTMVAPPELCVVNMYWNDLPGLVMDGREHVRLVDIHRQVLPAKDTGILKKRCYMLGLDVRQCSELQRDFLIRYMNAAKSKSTVVVSRTDAIHLIGFYVTPKSKPRTADMDDGLAGSQSTSDGVRQQSQVGVACHPGQPGQVPVAAAAARQAAQNVMMTHDRLSSQAAVTATVISAEVRRRSSEKTSPPLEGLKRSERLRDRRVHYADMVLGVHPRCSPGSESSDGEPKPAETPHPRPGILKPEHSSLPHPTRTGSRTSSTEKSAMSEAVTGEQHQSGGVSCRRRSMELRSAAEKRSSEDLAVSPHPVASSSRRRLSGVPQVPQEVADDVPMAEGSGKPEHHITRLGKERLRSGVNRHRARSGGRHKRRMMARHRLRLARMAASPELSNTSKDCLSSDTEELGLCSPIREDADPVKSDVAVDGRVPGTEDKPLCSTPILRRSVPIHSHTGSAQGVNTHPVKSDMSFEAPCSSSVEQYVSEALPPLTVNAVPVSHAEFFKRGRHRHSQDGVVLLDHYQSADAACVCCCTCGQLMSVAEFTQHLHRPGRRPSMDRRLGPRGHSGVAWREFVRRRIQYSDAQHWYGPKSPSPVGAEQGSESIEGTKSACAGEDPVSETAPKRFAEADSLKEALPVVKEASEKVYSVPVTSEISPAKETINSVKGSVPEGSRSPPVVGKPSATPEARVTRSHGGSCELVLGGKSSATDGPAATPRHSRRVSTSKNVVAAPAVSPSLAHSRSERNSLSHRVELRPRVPPRATAPK